MRKRLIIFLMAFIGILAALFVIFFVKVELAARLDNAAKADAIVVLGAASYAGKPSPVLQARLDHATELYKKEFAPIIITTGGTHPGEKFSEGESGKNYLAAKGVPSESIVAEEDSLTTNQNLARAYEIAKEKNISKIIIVSDPFHMYRASLIARSVGFPDALASPTKTSPISKNFWLNLWYVCRETVLSFAYTVFGA